MLIYSSSAGAGLRPAPGTYVINVDEHMGADTIEVASTGYELRYELVAQDLVYAYEGAWNQLVAAHGKESTPVKNGVYQHTGTFRACVTNFTKEDFTLKQLKDIIKALSDFAEKFSMKDLEFTYRLQGKRRHVVGFLKRDASSSLLSNATASFGRLITFPMNYHMAARPRDPYQTIAWDSLRLHPPATVELSSYGALIPIADLVSAVMGVYTWGWDLISEYDTDNILLHIRSPILVYEDRIKLDMKPDPKSPDWLPLWALRSVVMSVFDFGLVFGMREVNIKYEDEGERKIWGYITKGRSRRLPPHQGRGMNGM